MIIGVDGTGDRSNALYALLNKNSHVSQVINGSRQVHRKYFGGPAVGGMGTERIARDVVIWIRAVRSIAPEDKIFLIGHSRGGASLIRAAQIIQQEYFHTVLFDGVFLFDAVNFTIPGLRMITDIDKLPTNIVRCFHAIRDPYASSRSSFGNCGTIPSVPHQLVSQKFFGRHAALGGTPGTGDLKYSEYGIKYLGVKDTDHPREYGTPVNTTVKTVWSDIDRHCARMTKERMWFHLQKERAMSGPRLV